MRWITCVVQQMHFSWTESYRKAGLHKSMGTFLLIRIHTSSCCLMITRLAFKATQRIGKMY